MNPTTADRSGRWSEPDAPLLLVPYMWIGDFVRCHTVVRLLRLQHPSRPIDVLATTLVAPLLDYMPGVRKGIVVDLPRKRLALGEHRRLARRLEREGYVQALIMPRTWKSALAPYLAGIPVRTGFAGEMRFGLVNDMRWGERRLPRMVDRCATLALPRGQIRPEWPEPQLHVPTREIEAWLDRFGLATRTRPVIVIAPGAVGPSKRWPPDYYRGLVKRLALDDKTVWVIGGPGETETARDLAGAVPAQVRDLTGPDLRNAILALAAADLALSNDSGLLHVAAALGTPTIGIFGPTSPWHWAPLNPLAGVIENTSGLPCRPCHKPHCRLGHHQCMRDITIDRVFEETSRRCAQLQRRQTERVVSSE